VVDWRQICVKECTVLCEIGKSTFRGREVLYPEPDVAVFPNVGIGSKIGGIHLKGCIIKYSLISKVVSCIC
jgi:hypothetical protein